jgi:hypothetical protein
LHIIRNRYGPSCLEIPPTMSISGKGDSSEYTFIELKISCSSGVVNPWYLRNRPGRLCRIPKVAACGPKRRRLYLMNCQVTNISQLQRVSVYGAEVGSELGFGCLHKTEPFSIRHCNLANPEHQKTLCISKLFPLECHGSPQVLTSFTRPPCG